MAMMALILRFRSWRRERRARLSMRERALGTGLHGFDVTCTDAAATSCSRKGARRAESVFQSILHCLLLSAWHGTDNAGTYCKTEHVLWAPGCCHSRTQVMATSQFVLDHRQHTTCENPLEFRPRYSINLATSTFHSHCGRLLAMQQGFVSAHQFSRSANHLRCIHGSHLAAMPPAGTPLLLIWIAKRPGTFAKDVNRVRCISVMSQEHHPTIQCVICHCLGSPCHALPKCRMQIVQGSIATGTNFHH
mmetsp:Transcript_64486/g.141412  ORF Transcript_64486/g.141412 Transcript_64486/m.141412 type:complete len:248 (-) Transcript_64486:473-1216(-)